MLTEDRRRALFQEHYGALEEALFARQLHLAAARDGAPEPLARYAEEVAILQRALDNLATTYPQYLAAADRAALELPPHHYEQDSLVYQLARHAE